MPDRLSPEPQCDSCNKTFKQRSSLVRHAKKCTLEPAPSSRQKACSNCTKAKARCDLQRPSCSRCVSRDTTCDYTRPVRTVIRAPKPVTTSNCELEFDQDQGTSLSPLPNATLIGLGPVEGHANTQTTDCGYIHVAFPTDFRSIPPPESTSRLSKQGFYPRTLPSVQIDLVDKITESSASSSQTTPKESHGNISSTIADSPPHFIQAHTEADIPRLVNPALDDRDVFMCREFIRTVNSEGEEEIEPWILALQARPSNPDPVEVVNHSSMTLFRAFRSWPRMLAKGIQLPPIIHFFQFGDGGDLWSSDRAPQPLGKCITLCKMWVGQAEGSGQIVQDAVRAEIENILSSYRTYDAPTLLAAIQSLIMLLILLIFPSNTQTTLNALPPGLFCQIQILAYYTLKTGMVLQEEAEHTRPPWRVWAHIEAKRRTHVALYFFHWAYSVYQGTRHFNCLELGRMLAPGPKYLWQATEERTWCNLYMRWLAQWDGREIVQAEFFLVDKGPVMERRVEMWLEDADELGISNSEWCAARFIEVSRWVFVG
ncbi:hypothetical protein GGR57DRAFT_464845 [Xylariaceae sp. FL1272]|nr:hypothetical protein GGR57DRAFT_464845 [Xylariaceae sp. FL1272]